jgi:hypothetical protein
VTVASADSFVQGVPPALQDGDLNNLTTAESERHLALLKGRPLAECKASEIRSAMLAVSRDCRRHGAGIATALERWLVQQPMERNRKLLSCQCPESFRPAPFVSGVQKVVCTPPAIKLSRDVMQNLGEPQNTFPMAVGPGDSPCEDEEPQPEPEATSIHDVLESSWIRRLHCIEHKDCRPLGFVPVPKSEASSCRFAGMCLCGDEYKPLAEFRIAFVAELKKIFKKSPTNRLKPLFEKGYGVLRIDCFDHCDRADLEDHCGTAWYHLSHVNQTSWAASLTKVVPDADPENVSIATAAGHIALRAAPNGFRDLADEEYGEAQRPYLCWQMDLCPRIFAGYPLDRTYTLQLYRLMDGERLVCTFRPADLEVKMLDYPASKFWPAPPPPPPPPRKAAKSGPGGSAKEAAPLPVVEVPAIVDGDPEAVPETDQWGIEVVAFADQVAEVEQDVCGEAFTL